MVARIHPGSLVAMTTATLSLNTTIRNGRGYGGEPTPKKEKITPPTLLRRKFYDAWYCQEQRLSKLKTTREEFGDFSKDEGYIEYKYENGVIAKYIHSTKEEHKDNMGNLIYKDISYSSDQYYRAVYYHNSHQKEFEWTNKGIKHFDKEGKEDTKSYYGKLKIAQKRIEAEKKEGVTFKKMSKVEKAVSWALKDTKDMTALEKMLAKKTKGSR